MCTITVHVYGQYMLYNHVHMYNDNSGMYHEPRHTVFYTDNSVIVELNSI